MEDVRDKTLELGDVVAFLCNSRHSVYLEVGQIIGFTPNMVRIARIPDNGSDPVIRGPANVALLERGTLPPTEIAQL